MGIKDIFKDSYHQAYRDASFQTIQESINRGMAVDQDHTIDITIHALLDDGDQDVNAAIIRELLRRNPKNTMRNVIDQAFEGRNGDFVAKQIDRHL